MLVFRNIDAAESHPVETWGFEGLLTALDRGGLSQWRRIGEAVRNDPWGKVASGLEEVFQVAEDSGAVALLQKVLSDARQTDKQSFGEQFTVLLEEPGMTQAQAAAFLGTSRTRVNSYCNGAVTPSAIVVERLRQKVLHHREFLA